MQQLLIRFLADGTLLLVLALSVPFILLAVRKRFWDVVPIMVMAGLTSLVVAKMMSLLYQPAIARPFLELGVSPGAAYMDNPGFPSDHALLGTVVLMAAVFVVKKRSLSLVLATLVLAMCVGRVVALVHTPLDVVGGVLAGVVGAFWYRKLTK